MSYLGKKTSLLLDCDLAITCFFPLATLRGERCRQQSDFYTVDMEVRKAKERKVDKEITYM